MVAVSGRRGPLRGRGLDALIKAAASHELVSLVSLVSHEPDLEEIFLAYTAGHRRLPGQLASALAEGLKQWPPLTLFYQYAGSDPLRNGLDVGDAAVLLAVAAAMALVALVAFQRRDLAA